MLGFFSSELLSEDKSPWKRLQSRLGEYVRLLPTQIQVRTEKLAEIRAAVSAWRLQHAGGHSESERAKEVALQALEVLLAGEDSEVAAATVGAGKALKVLGRWIREDPTRRPAETDGKGAVVGRFAREVVARGRWLGAGVESGLPLRFTYLPTKDALEQFHTGTGGRARKGDDLSGYLKGFEGWLWKLSPPLLLTVESAQALKATYAFPASDSVPASRRVQSFIRASKIEPFIAGIRGGKTAENGIVVYEPGPAWVKAVGDYRVGKKSRQDPAVINSREQAEVEADWIEGFQHAGKLHLKGPGDIYVAIHEAVHLFHARISPWQVKEGITDYYARKVAASARIVPKEGYTEERNAVENLVSVVGEAPVAKMFFEGEGSVLQGAIDAAKGPDTAKKWVRHMTDNEFDEANALLA